MSEARVASPKGLMAKLSVMMFLQFWIWGAWFLTVNLYMTEHGMGASPYYAYTADAIAAMIAPFFLGLIADRFFDTDKILAFLFIVGGAALLFMPYIGGLEGTVVDTFPDTGKARAVEVLFMGSTHLKHEIFNWCIIIHMLCFMPTLGLTASLSFRHLNDSTREFPLVRLWRTFGWIFAGIALAAIFKETVDGKTIEAGTKAGQFYIAGGASVLLGIFCLFFLPKTVAPKKGDKISIGDLLFLDVWKEFKRPSFFVFMLCSTLLCIPLKAYYALLQAQMAAMQITEITIWKNVGTWLEAGMMFAMPFFFRKLGVKKMILVGIAAWIVRYALFPLAAGYPAITAQDGFMIGSFFVPIHHTGFLLVILGVALHGLCYDFFFVTGQIYVDQTTDNKIRGQAQAMNIFFTMGIGMYIGAKINFDWLVPKYFAGKSNNIPASLEIWENFWWPLCYMACAVFVLFLFAFKHKDKEDAEFSHGSEDDSSNDASDSLSDNKPQIA